MGGYGSGNWGGQPTVEDGLVLDLNELIRARLFRTGAITFGPLVWTEVYRGHETARIGFEAHLGNERGSACLRYTTTDRRTGKVTHHDYRIELVTTPQPFGGWPW